MSLNTSIEKLNPTQIDLVNNLRVCTQSAKDLKRNPLARKKYVYPCTVEDSQLTVPFVWGQINLNVKRPPRDVYGSKTWKFKGTPRPAQREVFKECLRELNKSGSVILSAYPGFGKTFLALKIAQKIKLKTIILINRVILQKQWMESIEKFSDACSAVLRPRTKNCSTKTWMKREKQWMQADIGIVNPQVVSRFDTDWWKQVGCVIVDECHQIMAKGSYTSLNFLKPRYVVALSATPYRPDGLNTLISLYFGTEQIRRDLYRPHQVYHIKSSVIPTTKLNMRGNLDWNSVLNSISQNDERNDRIVNICTSLALAERATLILTKRIQQAECLSGKLEAKNISVCRMYGKHSTKNSKAQVLIGTASKIGVGFDDARLDCLIVACDIDEYFIQYLGRVFRRTDSEPIIIDIVDNHRVLQKHWINRSRVYRKHGGIIKQFSWNTLENHLNANMKYRK